MENHPMTTKATLHGDDSLESRIAAILDLSDAMLEAAFKADAPPLDEATSAMLAELGVKGGPQGHVSFEGCRTAAEAAKRAGLGVPTVKERKVLALRALMGDVKCAADAALVAKAIAKIEKS